MSLSWFRWGRKATWKGTNIPQPSAYLPTVRRVSDAILDHPHSSSPQNSLEISQFNRERPSSQTMGREIAGIILSSLLWACLGLFVMHCQLIDTEINLKKYIKFFWWSIKIDSPQRGDIYAKIWRMGRARFSNGVKGAWTRRKTEKEDNQQQSPGRLCTGL